MKPRLSKDLGSELRILYLVSNIIQYTAVNLGCCFNNNQFSCYLYDIAELLLVYAQHFCGNTTVRV